MLACLGPLAVSLVFRFLWLDRLPGINGDEAWYGVQIEKFLAGQPWSGRTPSKLPINPLLFVSESLLLCMAEPSFWVLRLPVAMWCLIGLVLTFVLHRRVFHEAGDALLVVTFTASLPMHIAYSRFCWDASFSFATVPLVVYGLLGKEQFSWRVRFVALLVPGCVLTVWNHATHAVFVAACLLVLAWELRDRAWVIAKRWPRRPISAVAALIAAVVIAGVLVDRSHEARLIWRSVRGSAERIGPHATALGDILVGPRAYEYLAGVPRAGWTVVVYPAALIVLAAAIWFLARSELAADRRLAALTVITAVLVLLVGRRVEFNERSYERYCVYIVPLAAVAIVRSVRVACNRRTRAGVPIAACVTAAVSLFLLVQFWGNYFAPLRDQRHADRLHRTFWTGEREPKAELADAIRERAGAASTLYVEDWWIRWPVGYLLGGSVEVHDRFKVEEIDEPCFIASFAGGELTKRVLDDERLRDRVTERIEFGNVSGKPQLVLLVLGRFRTE